MKKNLTIVALVAIIVVCIGIVRSNFAEGEDDGYRSGRERALIKKFDKDGDGELSEEEKSAIRELEEQREKAYLKKYDTDGDGKISGEEKAEAQRLRKLEWVEKYDRNADGKVSDEEMEAARKSRDR